MSNTYTIRNSQNAIVTTIAETLRDSSSTSLVLHGRGSKNFGFDRDQNSLFLMENFSSLTAPLNPIDGQLWWKTGDQVYVYDTGGSPSAFVTLVPPPAGLGFNIVAGAGLTGGGFPTGSPLTTVLDIVASTGITVTADSISTNDPAIDHDNLSEYVTTEHIDHSTTSITPGTGFSGTSIGIPGGGTLEASRSLDVNPLGGLRATGVYPNQQLEVGSSVVRTFGDQTINGDKTFTSVLSNRGPGSPGTEALPSFGFEGTAGRDNGMYRSGPNELSFATNGTQRFRIESDGVLRTLNTTYESLVTSDDDIPNKKYVDAAAAAGGGGAVPTSNTFIGTWSISGLTIGKKYLITTHGTTRNNGNGSGRLGGCRLTQGTTPGSGTLIVISPWTSVNWPDGNVPQCVVHIVTAPSTSIAGTLDYRDNTPPAIEWRYPVYMMAVQLD